MSPRGGPRKGAGRPHGSVKLPDAKTFGVHLPGRLQRDLSDVLRPGESRSDAIREAIGLLVAKRLPVTVRDEPAAVSGEIAA